MSRQTYGSPKVCAELTCGQGVVVSCKTMEKLMRRAGLAGLPLRRKAKRVPLARMVTDLVKRNFRRNGPNSYGSPTPAEHPTWEGKLYCCVVPGRLLPQSGRLCHRLTPASRPRHQRPRHEDRYPRYRRSSPSTWSLRADHGTQFTSWTFIERAHKAGLLPRWAPSAILTTTPWPRRSEAYANRTLRPAALENLRRTRQRGSSSTSRASTNGEDATLLSTG